MNWSEEREEHLEREARVDPDPDRREPQDATDWDFTPGDNATVRYGPFISFVGEHRLDRVQRTRNDSLDQQRLK